MATNDNKQKRLKIDYAGVLKNLRTTWMLCGGSFTVIILASLILPLQWLPILAFLLILPITAYGNGNLLHHRPNCSLLTYYSIYSLGIIGISMLVMIMMNRGWFGASAQIFRQPEQPFIPSIVVYTVTSLMFGLALLRRGHTYYCKACRERASYSMKEQQERGLFHREVRRLLYAIFIMCMSVSIILWCYYEFAYINVNLNSGDIFFFYVFPSVVYMLSIIALSLRYASLTFKYDTVAAPKHDDFYTLIRFIVVRGNTLLLKEMEIDDEKMDVWDTPASIETNFVNEVTDAEATEYFKELSGITDFTIKPLFPTSTHQYNVFHFAAFLDSDETQMPALKGDWFNILQVDTMMKAGMVAVSFGYEIHRIYTMTMAWKTYHTDGTRKYAIKNYRPTFRLSDFKDWDLDYSDPQWLNIAENNADRPFFKLRKFWRKYISGEDNRWTQSRS